MSSAARTHLANFASIDGNPLNPHIRGSSNLFYNAKLGNLFTAEYKDKTNRNSAHILNITMPKINK